MQKRYRIQNKSAVYTVVTSKSSIDRLPGSRKLVTNLLRASLRYRAGFKRPAATAQNEPERQINVETQQAHTFVIYAARFSPKTSHPRRRVPNTPSWVEYRLPKILCTTPEITLILAGTR